MKSKQAILKRIFASFIIVAIMIICFLFAYNLTSTDQQTAYSSDVSNYYQSGYYAIDSETILERLDREEKAFTLLIATPEAYQELYFGPYLWKQSDYLKIAAALDQYVWKEAPDDWQINDMTFRGDCRYDPIGFDILDMTYFKSIGSKEYTRRKIVISPLYEEVDIGREKNLPLPFLGLKSLKLEKFKVTADEALQIAEQNGGRDGRLANNECSIFISISAYDQKWRVLYSYQASTFEIVVDPYTGEYKIPHANQ